MDCKIIDTKKGKVEFSIYGSGPPLLFIHGGHGNCRETLFHKGFDTSKFQIITPSRPGYSATPLLSNSSPKGTAELFIELLNELNIGKVILIGISAGGPTAIELASCFPERIEKLILISAVTKKWLSEADPTYLKAKKIFKPSIERYSWALFKLFYRLFPKLMSRTMFQELSTVKEALITKEETKELFEMIRKQRSYAGFINDIEQRIAPETISKINLPTLILHSLHDKSVKIEHATYANKTIKNSLLLTYKNKWGHLLWLGDESEQPIKDVLQFIG